jgi:hypothetical protein
VLRKLVLEIWLGKQYDLNKLLSLGLLIRHGMQRIKVRRVNGLSLVNDKNNGSTLLKFLDKKQTKGCLKVKDVAAGGETKRGEHVTKEGCWGASVT